MRAEERRRWQGLLKGRHVLSRSIRFVITHCGFFLAEKCRSQNSTLRKWDRTTHLLRKADTGQRRKKLVGIIRERRAKTMEKNLGRVKFSPSLSHSQTFHDAHAESDKNYSQESDLPPLSLSLS